MSKDVEECLCAKCKDSEEEWCIVQQLTEQNNKLIIERDEYKTKYFERMKKDSALFGKTIEKAEKERDDAVSQITHLNFLLGECSLKIAEYEKRPLEEVESWIDGLRSGYVELESQLAVCQQVLGFYASINNNTTYGYASCSGSTVCRDMGKKAREALSTTLTEAADKVNRMEMVLCKIVNWAIKSPGDCESEDVRLTQFDKLIGQAKEALQVFHGSRGCGK